MTGSAGLPYGIIDPDYARVFTIARITAWSYGYAITVHGSFTRDLDLLAVPWTDHCSITPERLMRRIADRAELEIMEKPPTEQPHGRLTWTLTFPKFGDPRWVDLSIFPPSLPAST